MRPACEPCLVWLGDGALAMLVDQQAPSTGRGARLRDRPRRPTIEPFIRMWKERANAAGSRKPASSASSANERPDVLEMAHAGVPGGVLGAHLEEHVDERARLEVLARNHSSKTSKIARSRVSGVEPRLSGAGLHEVPGPELLSALEERQDELGLRREVPVQGRLGDPRALDDVVHTHVPYSAGGTARRSCRGSVPEPLTPGAIRTSPPSPVGYQQTDLSFSLCEGPVIRIQRRSAVKEGPSSSAISIRRFRRSPSLSDPTVRAAEADLLRSYAETRDPALREELVRRCCRWHARWLCATAGAPSPSTT